MTKGTPIAVTWLDAENSAGWHQYEVPTANYQVSVGVFVDQCDNYITISFSHNTDADEWLALHSIPLGMVKDIQELNNALL